MKDYVSACTVSFINDKPLMDINYLEESFGGPQLSLAVLPKSGNVVMFQMDSRLHVDNLEKVLELAKKGCSDIHVLLRQTVHDYSQEFLTSLTGNWIIQWNGFGFVSRPWLTVLFKHFYNDIYDTYEKSELDQAFWEQNISLLLKFPLKPTTA